ncbi:MAG: hypothetical protein HKO01_07575 [Flaviramulus sp.]|nr:hypothetical protein [Flaviramulus sp.]NNC50377.1 hypothetical protein [Flaviramulus sp.]
MKKLAYIILGFIIGAILTYKFCPREAVDTSVISYKMPKDTISVAKAIKLSDNWAKYNPTEMDSLIELEGSKKVTRSVWWSLKDVNEYLVYAKAKSDSLGYNMTGIRVYLGNYGKNIDASKKNRNTMFIVPTGVSTISKASSINLFLPPSDGDIPAPPLNDGTGSGNGYPQ